MPDRNKDVQLELAGVDLLGFGHASSQDRQRRSVRAKVGLKPISEPATEEH